MAAFAIAKRAGVPGFSLHVLASPAQTGRRPEEQLAMKSSVTIPPVTQMALAVVGGSLLIAREISAQALVSAVVASPPPAQVTTSATAEAERIIITGSNTPTAEEVGPNPGDTHRPSEIEQLGIRNTTDLTTYLPQQRAGSMRQNFRP